jgi:hypothetical protein
VVGDDDYIRGGDSVADSWMMRLQEHDDDSPTYGMVFFLLLHICSPFSTVLLVEFTVGA